MFHTAPSKIESIHDMGIAGSCLFFSDDVYVMTASSSYYVYEADFNCVRASQLYDEKIVAEIALYFDIDEDTAESLLDGTQNEFRLDNVDIESYNAAEKIMVVAGQTRRVRSENGV